MINDQALMDFFLSKVEAVDDPIIIDVGAHVGMFASLPYTVHAFEPNIELLPMLVANAPYATIYPFAISDKSGKAILSIPPKEPAVATLGTPRRPHDDWEQVEVETFTLDQFGFPHVDFIKVDTEGHELNVLLGAEKLITRDHPGLLIEYTSLNTRQCGYERERIIILLKSWGYNKFKEVGREDLWAEVVEPDTSLETVVRTIIIAGLDRCGTSVMAGVCHKLGVHMGDEFVPCGHNNKDGTFEELKFVSLNRGATPPTEEDYLDYAKSRGRPVCGVRDSALFQRGLFPLFVSVLDDVRIILMVRSREAVIASIQYACGVERKDAVTKYDESKQRFDTMMSSFNGLVAEVAYDDLVNEPETIVRQIAEFVFDGVEVDPDIESAVSHIRPEARNFDAMGRWIGQLSAVTRGDWGNVAIGVRIARHPEPYFFSDWTAMISGGTRKGDIILRPQIGKPAHTAANAIARDFLRSGRDTLLMVDDDMTFPHDALERMRSNPNNQNYDIAFALCTHRQWPPKPIMMQLRDPQPPEPESKLGHSFLWVERFTDGASIEVGAVGLAFTLIRRHVFEAMLDRDYGPEWTIWFESMTRNDLFKIMSEKPQHTLEHSNFFRYGEGRESDDIAFCLRASDLDFRMCVDTTIKIGHIGHTVFGWDDYRIWLESKDV